MAFFNLWSSERLSFSLSIVAVVSAAITSYYQFFYHDSSVSARLDVQYLNTDTLYLKATFMNQGTHSIAIGNAKAFVTSAEAWESEPSNRDLNRFEFLMSRGELQVSHFNREKVIAAKSVAQILIPLVHGEEGRRALFEKAPLSLDPNGEPNRNIKFGLSVELIDPYGASSLWRSAPFSGFIDSTLRIGFWNYDISVSRMPEFTRPL